MSSDLLQFWGLAVGITVIAMAVLVVPLIHRRAVASSARGVYDINVYKDQLEEIVRDYERGLLDQNQMEAAEIEVKRRMLSAADSIKALEGKKAGGGSLSNTGMIATITLLVPAAAVAMYLNLGRPGVPDQPFADRAARAMSTTDVNQASLKTVAAKLAKRLQSRPDDLPGWMLLGRSYISLGQLADAAEAYGRAYKLSGKDSEVGADYAESLALAANSTITPQAKKIFDSSLVADPYNAKARFYLAMYKVQNGDIRGALQGWVDLAALSPADAPWSKILSQQIGRAGQQLGIDPQTIQPSTEAVALARQLQQQQQRQQQLLDKSAVPGPSSADMKAIAKMSDKERLALIRTMVQGLADRLKKTPNDKAGWQRLEKVYRMLGETAKADQAAANVAKLP